MPNKEAALFVYDKIELTATVKAILDGKQSNVPVGKKWFDVVIGTTPTKASEQIWQGIDEIIDKWENFFSFCPINPLGLTVKHVAIALYWPDFYREENKRKKFFIENIIIIMTSIIIEMKKKNFNSNNR